MMLISNAFMERDVPVLGIITALGLQICINSFESWSFILCGTLCAEAARRILSRSRKDTIKYSAREIPQMKRSAWILAALMVMLWPAVCSNAQTTKGAVVFENHCASCHGNPSAATPAPEVLSLWKLTPEAIYAAHGKAPHATLTGVTDDDFREVAF